MTTSSADQTSTADPIESARRHAVGLAALASLLTDERVTEPGRGADVDPERAAAVGLLPGFSDGLLTAVWERRGGVGNAMRSALGQLARAAEGRGTWDEQSDAVLIAQGRASANLAPLIATIVGEHPELAGRLDGGGTILDVGTGIGALARALAGRLPGAHVLGLDLAARPLELAARELADHPELDGRVTLRQGDVVDLDEAGAFDLIWLPAPFLSPDALDAAYRVCRRSLAPGGRLVVGLNGEPADEADGIARAWLASVSGRVDETPTTCRETLAELGFGSFALRPTVPGAPWLLDAGLG